MKVKLFFSLIFLANILLANTVTIPEGSPILLKPEIGASIVGESRQEMTLPAGMIKTYFHNKHPFSERFFFHEIQTGDSALWICPDLQIERGSNGGRVVSKRKGMATGYKLTMIISIIGLICTIYLAHRIYNLKHTFKMRGVFPFGASALILFSILLLRCIFVSYVLYSTSNVFIFPQDEHGYFKIASDLASLRFSKDWMYPIGYGVLLIPFSIMANTSSYWDVISQISATNCFFVASLSYAISFKIIENLSASTKRAAIATTILFLLPFFYFPVEMWEITAFKSLFALPSLETSSWRLYYIFHGIGFTGLSGYASDFFILLCLILGLTLPPKKRSFALISALLSFACMIRLSNIFFVPLFTYLFLKRLRDSGSTWKNIILATAFSSLAFLFVYTPQFYINTVAYGGPFTTSYVLHNNLSTEGFEFSSLMKFIPFLVNGNHVYVTIGITGLAFSSSPHNRAVFGLLGIPVFLFYCGYACGGDNPIRFVTITYIAFVGAFVSARAWGQNLSKTASTVLVAFFVINCILVSPCMPYVKYYRPFDISTELATIIWAITALISLFSIGFLFFKSKQAAFFASCFLIIFYVANPYFSYCLLFALIIWISKDFISVIHKEILKFSPKS